MRVFDLIINFIKKIFGKSNENLENETDNNQNNNPNMINEEETNTEQGNVTTEDSTIEEPQIQKMSGCGFVVLVDNGHGKNTPGKRSPYSACGEKPEIDYYEYKWSREIAERIVNEFCSIGVDARRIVTEETDISLSERVRRVNEICNKYGKNNVLLLSIHSNAAGSGRKWMTARGWSAFTTRGTTKSDELCDCLYIEAEKNFNGLKIRKDLSDGDYDMESDFYIIKNTKCPAVLSENFFHDNIEDTQYILSEEGRNAVVKTHVDGVLKYIEKHKN